MIYYYKRIDTDGNVVSLITCDQPLAESVEQKEISKEEYDELYVLLPRSEETNEADYIESLESLEVSFNE